MSYMTPLTLRIPPDLERQLQKLCKQQGRSASDVLRESLRRYMLAEQLRQTREKLRPFAQSNGFLTDEDVFKAVS